MKVRLTPVVLVALPLVLPLWGCQVHEQYHYKSTVHEPATVTLENHWTGEKLWSYEVPAGRQLNVKFMRGARSAERDGYDEMSWSVAGWGDDEGGRPSLMRVPPPSQRRLRMDLRQGPESPVYGGTTPVAPPPPAVNAASAPAPTPAEPVKPKSKAPEGIALPDPKQPAPK